MFQIAVPPRCRFDVLENAAGFQQHVRRPYLMITALRNPLEVFVSAKQYTHKRKTKTLEQVKTRRGGVDYESECWWARYSCAGRVGRHR